MRFIFKVFLPLLFVIAGALALYAYNEFESFKSTKTEDAIASFEIKKGSNIRRVASSLQSKNILKTNGLI